MSDTQQAATAASTPAAPPVAALPSLNPSNSPYQPLSLPEVATPRHSTAPEPATPSNLGAGSKASGIAYLISHVLHGAVQGYDSARLQQAQQTNQKLQALQQLDQQITSQYRQAYSEVGSTPKPDGTLPTPQEIAADPRVAGLAAQGAAVHDATLKSIQAYLPQLQQKPKKGKSSASTSDDGQQQNPTAALVQQATSGDPNAALQAYYQASAKLGWSGKYAVPSQQELAAMAEQRRGAAATQTAATAKSELDAKKASLEADLLDATTKGDTARADKARQALTELQEATSPYRQPSAAQLGHESYLAALNSGQVPKDENGLPRSEEWWNANQKKAGTVAASPVGGGSEWAAGLQAYAKENKLDPAAWSTIRAYDSDRYSAKNPLADRRLALAQRSSDIAAANLALRQSSNDFNDMTKIFKQIGPDTAIQGTAQASEEYVKHPTGPGDVALTLAFFEVAKAADPGSGSGIRFTQQEQNLIRGARGWADAAQANVEKWGKGTLYDDSQRAQMQQIIKMAARRSNEVTASYLGAAGKINPRATAAAAGGANPSPTTPSPSTPPAPSTHTLSLSALKKKYPKATAAQLDATIAAARKQGYEVTK